LLIDWNRLAVAFAEWLAGDDIQSARRRVAKLSPADRCRRFIQFLEISDEPHARRLANVLSEGMRATVPYA